MKAAVIQLRATDKKEENIAKAVSFVRQAVSKKAELIVLPEVFNYRGALKTQRELQAVAEDIPGKSLLPLMEIAKAKKVFIIAGSIYEKTKEAKKAYNTSVLIDKRGKVIAKYRKKHLFQAVVDGKRIRESRNFLAGKSLRMVSVGEMRLGMSVCYDLRFPEMFQAYQKQGAHIFSVPSCFTKQTGEAHWELLLRTRAVENFCYVLAPNQTGKDSRGISCYGNSMIVDPWGTILARASANREEIVYAHLRKETLRTIRRVFDKM